MTNATVLREPFDYTEWRRENLFVEMSIEDISREAMETYRKQAAFARQGAGDGTTPQLEGVR